MDFWYDCFLLEKMKIESEAQIDKFRKDARFCTDVIDKRNIDTVTGIHIVESVGDVPDRYIRLMWKRKKHLTMPFVELQGWDEITVDRMLDIINAAKAQDILVHFDNIITSYA